MRAFLPASLFSLLTLAAAACSAATDPSPTYQEGKQYQVIKDAPAPKDAKRISVEEFFCFCCPHCYAADAPVAEWRKHKSADVDFTYVPNTLGRPDGETQARAFYIAKAAGVEDKIHLPLFQAIHEQRIPMASLPAVRDLFQQEAGMKPEKFDELSSSVVVDSDLRNADALARSYNVTSTPTFVVGGKYSVTGGSPELAKILDFLTDKVRKDRKS